MLWGKIILGGKSVKRQIVLGAFCIGGLFVSGGFFPRWFFDGWLVAKKSALSLSHCISLVIVH